MTTKPVLSEYNGPEYVIYNHKTNRTKGIAKLDIEAVYETCEERNHTDPALQNWVQVSNPEIKPRI